MIESNAVKSQDRPTPDGSRRQPNGLLAWQATLAYIAVYHSPDALLEIGIYPGLAASEVQWAAEVTWARVVETVIEAESLEGALHALWQKVAHDHDIFLDEKAAQRRPEGYAPGQWVDATTGHILQRLIDTLQAVFLDDWRVVAIYQPTEVPHLRVQMRLMARHGVFTMGGRGPSFLEAARDLYRHAAPMFVAEFEKGGDAADFDPLLGPPVP